ncbi:uncharacterized protein involved in exopolysaccharide biosynthesis [Hypnocyclicus thermotrophus]|uniref:Uncharacterized protein involved in exopolysaccharide biosynthesis n=1 Tax=Hypnocyclicus thermotrophus TaxID=1627895 RepID=A0AA46I4Z6_9FUSO|nr:Wzz/FepE/Etk N-terminal domain-containing protein [Hypnocyclicus thermotrophus]TDT67863.1 uncharacterized protein involved in exopolysaccharide biosynthesis [Hypnocyclicus thermotrophus]
MQENSKVMQNEIINQNNYYEEDEIDLLDLIRVIWKRKTLIIIITVLVTIFGGIFALISKPLYKAELTFTEEKSSSSSMLSSLANSIPFGLIGGTSNNGSSSLLTILESRTFREEIVNKLGLYDYYIKYNKIELDKIEDENDKPTIYDVAKWVGNIVVVSKDEKNGIYRVEVELSDKEMVAKIANEYFTVLDNYLKEQKDDKSNLSLKYLKEQVDTVEKQINDKQAELREIEKKYKTVSILDEAKVVTEKVAELKQFIIQKENELKISKKFAGENSFEVQKIKEEIIVAKEQLNAIINGDDNLPVDIIPLRDIPQIKFELQKLEQELNVNIEVYKMLRVEYEKTKLEVLNKKSMITILDSAIDPKYPDKPNKKLIVVISFVLGGFLGIFFEFFIEFLKNIEWDKITEEKIN